MFLKKIFLKIWKFSNIKKKNRFYIKKFFSEFFKNAVVSADDALMDREKYIWNKYCYIFKLNQAFLQEKYDQIVQYP